MRKTLTIVVIISIFVSIQPIRVAIEDFKSSKYLSLVGSYAQEYYSKNQNFLNFCSNENVRRFLQSLTYKQKGYKELQGETLMFEFNNMENIQGEHKSFCYSNEKFYQVEIRSKLNAHRFCGVNSYNNKSFCTYDNP